ncbi:MAG: hypothetical protein DLM55_04475 [Acidimicrobiales bacterium]|nr:MAG: hypothetical protein DLM55_04475 [Acidimicrobiales bacterium]
MGEEYEGISVSLLSIDEIDWEYRGEYIRTRTVRKSLREFDVEPEWATAAALDRYRLVGRDSASKSGQAVRIVGYSPGAGRALAVIVIPKEHPPTGAWWGVNAWAANDTDTRRYERWRSE